MGGSATTGAGGGGDEARSDGCGLCGAPGRGKPSFWAAFPERDGDRAAFPITVTPPVPAWRMAECGRCGALSPDPYPAAADIERYYRAAVEPDEWELQHYVRKDLTPGALDGEADMADKVTRLRGGPGRLLEVGCAAGWQLAAARDLGWEVQGIEAAPKFSAFARDEQGLDVFAGTLDEAGQAELGTFDVLLAFDVFEHLHDPVAALIELRRMARPGSTLLVTTPDISSRMARFWGLRWRQILPSHINYSTPASMAAVLERTGWRLGRISEPRYFDPDPARERRNRAREMVKFGARVVLTVLVVHPSSRWPALRRLPPLLTLGRVSWERFAFGVGDQPVLGDVMLVVAEPAPIR